MPKLKTYCINLTAREDRRGQMQTQFDKHDVLDAEFVEAVNGKALKEFPQGFGTANKFGCVLSHLKAIETAKYRGDSHALIVEDDVVFCDDLEKRLDKAFEQLPENWAMLYLGYFPQPTFVGEPEPYSESLVKLNGHLGAFSYIIRDSVYDTAIRELARYDHVADFKLAFIHKIYNCFSVDPFCVYVIDDYSDLSQGNVSYPQIKEKFKAKL